MIQATITGKPFQVAFTNGEHSAFADVPKEKLGDGRGFGPHELLEAALATCLAITLEKYAAKHNLPLEGASAEVRLIRSENEGIRLNYSLKMTGTLSDIEREQLAAAAARCPVATTLSGRIACCKVSESAHGAGEALLDDHDARRFPCG